MLLYLIFYCSIFGHTREYVHELVEEKLSRKTCPGKKENENISSKLVKENLSKNSCLLFAVYVYRNVYLFLVENKCEPNPCINGGTCSESEDDYVCTCREGFLGHSCESKKPLNFLEPVVQSD